MREWRTGDITALENRHSFGTAIPGQFTSAGAAEAIRFHRSIPAYWKTPLVSLPALARKMKIRGLYVKDESKRFSLNAFKGLGGSYAMFRVLCEKLSLDPGRTGLQDLIAAGQAGRLKDMEFVTCTDGNHGKGVSWAAGMLGCKAHVYMPYGSQEVRAEAIRKAGTADVAITDLSYDETVRYAKTESDRLGWILIQDTSWEGYEAIPAWIIQGYLTMAEEATEDFDRLGITPTHVFLQAGVGAMAGGVLSYLADHYSGAVPVATIVEPEAAACIYLSAKADDGNPHTVEGSPVTIMAGLNCGTPCSLTWPVLRDCASFYISCSDRIAAEGMRSYAAGLNGDPAIVSGESGAASLGAAESILTDASLSGLREAMGLGENSVLFLINTEGDTDPENYREILSGKIAL